MKANFSLSQVARVLWAATLVSLPVTSFRYFPFLGEGTVVRPLALYPVAFLAPVLIIQIVRNRANIRWPGALFLLGLFALVAAATTAVGALYAPIGFVGNEYWGRALRAWATLVIGLLFFWSAMWMNQNESDLRFTLKWLFVGLVLNLFWSGVQTIALYSDFLPKNTVSGWQRLFSVRGLVGSKRISGFAYEPSWLTSQLNTIYIPWLFAAILANYRLGSFRAVKYILLLGSLALIVLAYSRGGLGTLVISATLTLLLTGRNLARETWRWFFLPFRSASVEFNTRRLTALGVRIGMFVGIIGLFIGTIYFLTHSRYISSLWSSRSETLLKFIIDNYAGSRLAYAWAAVDIFQQYPYTGVGLGASGFYMFDNLPDWSYTSLYQTVWQLSPRGRFYLNPKSIYVRLLAETGIIGTTLFLSFYAYLLGIIRSLLQKKMANNFIGIAGLFSWLAIITTCITQDSFAIPNIWVNPGILVGLSSGLLLESAKTTPSPKE